MQHERLHLYADASGTLSERRESQSPPARKIHPGCKLSKGAIEKKGYESGCKKRGVPCGKKGCFKKTGHLGNCTPQEVEGKRVNKKSIEY